MDVVGHAGKVVEQILRGRETVLESYCYCQGVKSWAVNQGEGGKAKEGLNGAQLRK